MILDQLFEEEKPVVLARQRFTWYEKIIIAIALLIVFYREATSSLVAYELE